MSTCTPCRDDSPLTLRALGVVFAALAGLHCSGGATLANTDASSDVADAPPRDVPPTPIDAAPPEDTGPRGRLFDPCTSDAQCPSANRARCLVARAAPTSGLGNPQGMCSRPCARDADCADGNAPGLCTSDRLCAPSCDTLADCRSAYACLRRSPRSWCTAFCVSDADCGGGAVCNRWKNVCFAPPYAATGSENGAPCSGAGQCKGYCQPETLGGAPTGYLGGQCFSQFVRPGGPSTGPEIWRQETCPEGSLGVPVSGEQRGEIAPCMPRCQRDAECRPGYACRRPVDTDPATTDGICDRMNCNDGEHRCPAGYECDTDGHGLSMSEPIGVCGSSTP